MSGSIRSEYVIDLELQDNSKDAIRALEKGLKGISDIAKKAASGTDMSKNLEKAESAAEAMINKIGELSKDTSLDLDGIVKAYAKSSQKAVSALEVQYAKLKDEQTGIEDEHKRLTEELKKQRIVYDDIVKHGGEAVDLALEMRKTEERIKELGYEQIGTQIKQNREIRAKLVASSQQAKINAAVAKQNEKLKSLQDKRNTETSRKEKKSLDEQIKQQKALIASMKLAKTTQEACAKQQEIITKAIQNSEKAESKFVKAAKVVGGVLQGSYNVTGMIGGAAHTGKAVVSAGLGIARGIGSAVSAVASGADQEVERERQANRVKGMGNDDAKSMLRELNVYTGADYGTIVDAINRVQGTLGRNLQRGELSQAVEMELRYPGISTAFASQSGTNEAGAAGYRQYAAKLNAIQKVTGASADQIAASTQAFANRKDLKMAGGAVSDYQAVYLAMQNSGAFETEDELDAVFKKFVQKQSASGKGVFEFAKDFKMADYVHDARNKLQAQTADRNMDWDKFAADLKANEGREQGPSDAEKLAIKMREMEDKKNQLLMKLIPAVFPIVEKIANLITSPDGEKIVDGLVNLFNTVIPMLEPIFTALGAFLSFMSEAILPKFQLLIEKVGGFFDKMNGNDLKAGDRITVDGKEYEVYQHVLPPISQKASGGIALGPSLVGERGPEAIIPLDYARAQRADNIATSITQTFNMGSGATTAMSLAQAVRSRDFTRAMSENAYISKRCGVFG